MSALIALMTLGSAFAADPVVTQKNSQEMAELLNRRGSDQSMEGATTKAMQALMDLSASRVPSAVQNGYQAYGKFRNSENLDDLGYANARNKAAMAAMGQSAQLPPFEPTSFRRLNPNFLREGEAGRIAAEFERQSGMKREKFLSILSTVSEKKIDPKDPQMIDKVLSRFESFLAEIPNKEFKANLEKAIKAVPDSARKGVIAKAVAQFANFAGAVSDAIGGSSGTGASVTASTASASAATSTTAKPEPTSGYQAVTGASTTGSANTKELGALSGDGANINNVPVDGIVQAAINAQNSEGESIFQQVTRRYRIITPSLVNRSEMGK